MSHWNIARGHFLTRTETARTLGTTASEVRQRTDLLAVASHVGLEEVYPAFQFSGRIRLPQMDVILPEVLEGMSSWEAIAWFETADARLGGKSPADWLAGGGPADRVTVLINAARPAA